MPSLCKMCGCGEKAQPFMPKPTSQSTEDSKPAHDTDFSPTYTKDASSSLPVRWMPPLFWYVLLSSRLVMDSHLQGDLKQSE